MSELVDTTEMYLKSIYEMMEDGVVPLRARIVERLGHSGPTVSQTIARMERDGLVTVEDDRHIMLSKEGMKQATSVMRKHRLAELLLTEKIGMSWVDAHDEACRWEHVMRTSRAVAGAAAKGPFAGPLRQPHPGPGPGRGKKDFGPGYLPGAVRQPVSRGGTGGDLPYRRAAPSDGRTAAIIFRSRFVTGLSGLSQL